MRNLGLILLAAVVFPIGTFAGDDYRVVFVAQNDGLFLLTSEANKPKRLTTGRFQLVPSWSSDRKRIAFLSMREQDWEVTGKYRLVFHSALYVMDSDGKNLQRLTTTPVMFYQWSPDGKQILFQSSYEDPKNKGKDGLLSSAIYVMDADGTSQKRLTPIAGKDFFPSWSPEGQRLAFCSDRDGTMDIHVMDDDGGTGKRLTDSPGQEIGPIWSPDGKRIAFSSNGNGVWLVNVDDRRQQRVLDEGQPIDWSPNGAKLLISTGDRLYTITTDGKNRTILTKKGRALDGVFSDDGTQVFYRSNRSGKGTVYRVSVDGTKESSVTEDSTSVTAFTVSGL